MSSYTPPPYGEKTPCVHLGSSYDDESTIKKTSGLTDEISYIKLCEISGLHPLLESILQENTPRSLPFPVVKQAAMLAWLAMHPVILHRHRGKVYCIANTQALLLANQRLPVDTKIPSRWYQGRITNLTRLLVSADVQLNAIAYREDKKLLWHQHRLLVSLLNNNFQSVYSQDLAAKSKFSRAFRIDSRHLKP